MGATLNMANSIKAYTISDRATWLNFNNKDILKKNEKMWMWKIV